MFSETGTMGLRLNPLHIINRVAMKKLGESLTDKELEDMMRQADVDGDGRINYEGNCTILLKFFGFNQFSISQNQISFDTTDISKEIF